MQVEAAIAPSVRAWHQRPEIWPRTDAVLPTDKRGRSKPEQFGVCDEALKQGIFKENLTTGVVVEQIR